MKYTSQNKFKQLTLDMFKSSFKDLDKTNRWVMLGDSLPWAELAKVYNSRLNNAVRGQATSQPAWLSVQCLFGHL